MQKPQTASRVQWAGTLAQKPEWIALDYGKFIAALLIVCLHAAPLQDLSAVLSYGLSNVLCRLAVPFFFLCAGFFLCPKLEDGRKTAAYLGRILLLYLLCSLLYAPQSFWEARSAGVDGRSWALYTLRCFFFTGSYTHLWYLRALLVAAALLYAAVRWLRLPLGALLGVGGVLYGFGVCGNAYQPVFLHLPGIGPALSWYLRIFSTTRGGLLFGFFFVALGYGVRLRADRLRPRRYWAAAAASLVLMAAEALLVRILTGAGSVDMLVFTAPASLFTFLALCFVSVPERRAALGRRLRHLSTLLYEWHMLALCWLTPLLFWARAQSLPLLGNRIVLYLLVCAVCCGAAWLWVRLAEHKCRWLRYFY